MRIPVAILALLGAVPLSGCVGGVDPAHIPQDALDANGWQNTRDTSESRAGGLAKIVTRDYAPLDAGSTLGAGVKVVSATDVPFVDESRYLPDAIAEVERANGIRLQERGERTLVTAAYGALEGTEYDVQGAAVPGRALIALPPCGDFVVLVAFGATGGGGGLLGGGAPDLYAEALRVSSAIEC